MKRTYEIFKREIYYSTEYVITSFINLFTSYIYHWFIYKLINTNYLHPMNNSHWKSFPGHSADGNEASKRFEDEEDQALKRSSTVHSRTSLISSGSSSRASSVPPLIIQNCQPQDIHIPERRQSNFSVESGGVELGKVLDVKYRMFC